MRIQYLSDVHIEFHSDKGESFVGSLDPSKVDVLVIAGDFAVGAGIGTALDLICPRYAPRPVIYVHGNHEFYGTTRANVVAETREACARNSNLRWLDCDVLEIGETRFIGAPLWFRDFTNSTLLHFAMNDFKQIQGFADWVYVENQRALDFLERELRIGDVVVTHYLPTEASIAPRWQGDALNAFFLCDVESLIRSREPQLWIHGHTHDSVDATVGATRVVANPFGYVRIELNHAFVDHAVIEI